METGVDDERLMRRAIELAREPAFTSPNPRVGAVLVKDGAIISEGFHRGAGTPHAEAVALAAVDARGATCYVNLEPCAHHAGTPPCVHALVDAGIQCVVASVEDADERVRGSGFAYLREHGVDVTVGVLEREARDLNAAFLHQRTTGRPLVTLKLALTVDGRLAASDRSSQWITGDAARAAVHRRRVEVDAVMVGAGTVMTDDPSLTARAVPAPRQPARVVVDAVGRVSPDANVFAAGGDVIVATTDRAPHDRHTAWKEAGAEVLVLPSVEGRVDLSALVDELARREWLEVLCEGGAQLATSLLRDDLVDRLELYYGAVLVGSAGPAIGDLGIPSLQDAHRLRLVEQEQLGDDIRVVYARVGS